MKAKTKETSPHSTAHRGAEPTHPEIAIHAYFIWQSDGCPAGLSLEHWLQAETMLWAKGLVRR
ncbi:MAG: DUF2934 domain-containing protein [Chthoniobacteraceae bacterium]